MQGRRLTAALALATGALLAGCAATPPVASLQRAEEWTRHWGTPTARHTLPEGSVRLEYASGPYGRTTWMVDIDAAGRVMQARQVLTEAELLQVQATPDLNRASLLRWIGSPGERRPGGRPGGEVWSWRYVTNDCLWFQASVADDGRVTGSAFGIDPRCDAPSDARS